MVLIRVAMILAAVGWLSPASAQIVLNASRTDLLYSHIATPDCSMLSKTTDPTQLPLNVARLTVMNAPVGRPLTYRWSMKKSAKGTLAADLDLGPGAGLPSIGAMCSSFGNACILTPDRLGFYNEDHILWVGPTCDVLPKDTRKMFHGGVSRVQVTVLDGHHKVGKASVDLHWGMNGSITLFVRDLDNRFQNGMPRPYPVNVVANPIFGFELTPPNPLPQGTMKGDFSGGGTASNVLCPAQFLDCFEVVYPAAGRYIELLTVFFEEGSALCDNITVNVAECSPDARLDVTPRPRRTLYDPANPGQRTVDLTVRLRNTSQPKAGLPACPFLLQGASVLSCTANLKVGTVTDSKTTTFDLRHCSATTSQPCDRDAECSPAVCDRCQPAEVCLTQPHCSKSFNVKCGTDGECAKGSTTCPNCEDGETCVKILDIGTGREAFVPAGGSIELFHQPVTLTNVLGSTAILKDTWTANVFIPSISADDTLKYRIRGRPTISPR